MLFIALAERHVVVVPATIFVALTIMMGLYKNLKR